MARYLIILSLLFAAPAYAEDAPIADYVPPPMFSNDAYVVVADDDFPPLPPRRPSKTKVSKSYIQKLLKREQSATPIKAHRSKRLEDNLIEPSAQDILEQINPQ